MYWTSSKQLVNENTTYSKRGRSTNRSLRPQNTPTDLQHYIACKSNLFYNIQVHQFIEERNDEQQSKFGFSLKLLLSAS